MSTPSTEPMWKRDVVVEHVHQLLRLLLISGIVAAALSAFYVTALLLHFELFLVLAGESVGQRLYGVVAVFRQRLKAHT